MKCMHCRVEFHANENLMTIGHDDDGGWGFLSYVCPACKRHNLYLRRAKDVEYDLGRMYLKQPWTDILVWPRNSSRPPCPPEVPQKVAIDYSEACLVLADSPKASAALSRRCLQNLLRDAAKVKPGNLADEIQQVLDVGRLPSYLAENIDAIRKVGNFAAHPMKSQATGAIVEVESEEAGWNLDVLEALFDFYYVQPALARKKRDALNQKLQDAGGKPMK